LMTLIVVGEIKKEEGRLGRGEEEDILIDV
jgi:hypothetical protein